MGYYDATIKEVRRRKRELRWKGLLSPQLVSPTAKGEIDPDALN
jgi:hypothetical protein